jgi:hypothetical protein
MGIPYRIVKRQRAGKENKKNPIFLFTLEERFMIYFPPDIN